MDLVTIAGLCILPGVIYFLGFFFLSKKLYQRNLPPAIADGVATGLVLIPVMALIMFGADFSVHEVLIWPDDTSSILFYSAIVGSLVWAVLIFGLGSKLDEKIYNKFFKKWPGHLNLIDHIENDTKYTSRVFVYAWTLSLLANSLAAPIVEELYFRGYLLSITSGSVVVVVILNSFLFASYHVWSPWQIPTRTIAMLPMIYAVILTGNIYISIIVHLLLNLVGDSFSTLPMLLKKVKNKEAYSV